ncbi:hypothetical protein B1J93_13585 [Leptospira kirschneri serovar Pomona]|uniref:Uncharacterized protein n=1 Tax=Leptospira kirschneri serovar Pomona TaxID=561005 RepID=A0A1T1DL82_9LEPT|nr:hypothetical protein [Leptospira kirschneri]OOV41323.1 hypothetical protein B1J93_13585 [Leptospira kirschneri serovar Pomona]
MENDSDSNNLNPSADFEILNYYDIERPVAALAITEKKLAILDIESNLSIFDIQDGKPILESKIENNKEFIDKHLTRISFSNKNELFVASEKGSLLYTFSNSEWKINFSDKSRLIGGIYNDGMLFLVTKIDTGNYNIVHNIVAKNIESGSEVELVPNAFRIMNIFELQSVCYDQYLILISSHNKEIYVFDISDRSNIQTIIKRKEKENRFYTIGESPIVYFEKDENKIISFSNAFETGPLKHFGLRGKPYQDASGNIWMSVNKYINSKKQRIEGIGLLNWEKDHYESRFLSLPEVKDHPQGSDSIIHHLKQVWTFKENLFCLYGSGKIVEMKLTS